MSDRIIAFIVLLIVVLAAAVAWRYFIEWRDMTSEELWFGWGAFFGWFAVRGMQEASSDTSVR